MDKVARVKNRVEKQQPKEIKTKENNKTRQRQLQSQNNQPWILIFFSLYLETRKRFVEPISYLFLRARGQIIPNEV